LCHFLLSNSKLPWNNCFHTSYTHTHTPSLTLCSSHSLTEKLFLFVCYKVYTVNLVSFFSFYFVCHRVMFLSKNTYTHIDTSSPFSPTSLSLILVPFFFFLSVEPLPLSFCVWGCVALFLSTAHTHNYIYLHTCSLGNLFSQASMLILFLSPHFFCFFFFFFFFFGFCGFFFVYFICFFNFFC